MHKGDVLGNDLVYDCAGSSSDRFSPVADLGSIKA